MLTIGQLASAAGVTVRAVRHYHQLGLLPEPGRDHSGYRRYDAAAVVTLVRIRVLADAGVPLSLVESMLAAGPEEFRRQVDQVDRRLRAEIRERKEHRERIARLAAGESLALPPEVVAYLARVRELGFDERIVTIERDSWILIQAQMPEAVPELMTIKRAMIEEPGARDMFELFGRIADCDEDDPRLQGLADELSAALDELERAAESRAPSSPEPPIGAELAALLDSAFCESVPSAGRLMSLLEQRGWTGWTNIRRVDTAPGDRRAAGIAV